MDKEVIPWFQMMMRDHHFQPWLAFNRALESQYRLSPFDCPCSALFKLSQSGSVTEYHNEFTALAN